MTVTRALLYKEWIKLWRYCAIPPLLGLGALSQGLLSIKGFRGQHGAAIQYADMMSKETVVFSLVLAGFVLGGIVLALAQFLPDCQGRRLRLTFHLPVESGRALRIMLGAGFLLCLATFVMVEAAFALGLSFFGFPPELKVPMFLTLCPWGLAMWVAYCATAAFVAEPNVLRKACWAICGAAWVSFAAPVSGYGVGSGFFLKALSALLWMWAVEAAALRVREGE